MSRNNIEAHRLYAGGITPELFRSICLETHPGELADGPWRRRSEGSAKRGPVGGRITAKTKSGEERWLANAAIEVRDAQDRITILGLLQNITTRIRALTPCGKAGQNRAAGRHPRSDRASGGRDHFGLQIS